MLTLITVNYNNARGTVGLLKSLEEQTDGYFDVIVVDNDSSPDDRAMLGQYAVTSKLSLDVIYSDRNRGFSGGNNIAIRKALEQGSEWLMLINNDTTVSADFIVQLRRQLPDEPSLVSLPLSEGERTAYAGLFQWFKMTLPHLYDSLQLETYSSKLLYVIGAGLLAHRKVFEHVGLLDEAYFLYFEDADFSLRARRAGVPFVWLTGPTINHRVSESTKTLGAERLLKYHARNALRFNWRQGPLWVRAILPFWSLWVLLKQGIKIIGWPQKRAASLAIASGVIDFYAGKTGKL
jgi:GT2 family glycosyltransferase